MTWRAAALAFGVAVCLAVVAAAAVVAVRGRETGIAPGVQPVAVRRWLEPESQLFGDSVVATIDVIADSRRVDVGSVSVKTLFAPYDVIGEPQSTRTVDGPLVRLRTRYRLQCLVQVCVPKGNVLPLKLEPAKVTYLRVDGSPGRPRTVGWPPLTIASQLRDGAALQRERDLSFAPPLVARIQPPGMVSWRIGPWLAESALFGGAAVLVGLAALLALPVVRRKAELEPAPETAATPELTPLERALVGLDWARAAGGSREQRKALELLAEELDADAEDDLAPLADDARVLAWSARLPGDESTATLSRHVHDITERRAAALAAMQAEHADEDVIPVDSRDENGRHA
jgi:hypothetical protein